MIRKGTSKSSLRGGRRPTKQSDTIWGLLQIRFICCLAMTALILCFFYNVHSLFAEAPSGLKERALQKLNAEIIEVQEQVKPPGSAIYTVRDLTSGKTIELFAHPHRSTIQMGGKLVAAADVLGGSKATIVYQNRPHQEDPEIVFARITSSYYS